MKEPSFEKSTPTGRDKTKAERAAYRARPSRDRAVAAIPEILWRAEERDRPKSPEPELATSVPPEEATQEILDAQMLELYSLAQEYGLEPTTLAAVQTNDRVNALATLDTSLGTEEYLKNLEKLFVPETQKIPTETEKGTEVSDELKNAVSLRKSRIKTAIVELMRDPQLRKRYLAEISGERSLRRARESKVKLTEVLKLQTLKSRLQEERRRLRVEEFLAREEGVGKPRSKASGLTPQAMQNLERGISEAERLENEKILLLNVSERGLLTTKALLSRKRELEEKGFVISPSRERLVAEIAELTAQGYRVFLGGPTGTGKTSLALFALKEMTGGNYSWITWTGETSVRDLFGSPKITTTPEGRLDTGMTKGPITRAVIGEKSGILHEEFTAGQTSVQMSMKTVWASHPGEQINLPGFNGTEFTKSELIELATGNLKGKRHQERETMDPAVAREQKALEVGFMPANETRDYLILPMLIDRTGLMPVSRLDLEMITQFSRAADTLWLA